MIGAVDELLWTRADVLDHLRQAYAALGWSLWCLPGYTLMGEHVTWFYASTGRGGRFGGHGETIAKTSPLATLEAVLAHPSTRKALAG